MENNRLFTENNLQNLKKRVYGYFAERFSKLLTNINEKLSQKQDKLSAGAGIRIKDNIIDVMLDTDIITFVDELPNVSEAFPKIYVNTTDSHQYAVSNGVWKDLGTVAFNAENYYTKDETLSTAKATTMIEGKQDKLESGNNIKTIEGRDLLGNGDVSIIDDVTLNSTTSVLSAKKTKELIDNGDKTQVITDGVALHEGLNEVWDENSLTNEMVRVGELVHLNIHIKSKEDIQSNTLFSPLLDITKWKVALPYGNQEFICGMISSTNDSVRWSYCLINTNSSQIICRTNSLIPKNTGIWITFTYHTNEPI